MAARPTVTVSDREGVRQLRVRAPGARRVEVMGDFTDWEAVELSPAGELFERAIPITSGTHRLLLRIDGGEWIPAANTPGVDDDLGGRVGLLVVP
jgi:1,4-alpha-glucan branching enzyme